MSLSRATRRSASAGRRAPTSSRVPTTNLPPPRPPPPGAAPPTPARRAGAGGGEPREYAAADLGLVYRGSAFTRGRLAGRPVLWAEFALWPGDAATLPAPLADFDERRPQ